MNSVWEVVLKLTSENDGVITTKQIEAAGVSRAALKRYVENGLLSREFRGCYRLASKDTDDYALLQMRSRKLIYSYGTALYFWGLSDRVPHILDVTVSQGTNIARLKGDTQNLRVHYAAKELYEIGITNSTSPQGRSIVLYDQERCICDLVASKKKVDAQLYADALREYFKDKPDTRKLLKYSKKLGVEEQIRTYMEVLL